LRELHEEFGLALPNRRIIWARAFPAMDAPGQPGWFMGLKLAAADVAAIRFGDEGREPQLLEISAFLAATDAIPPLQSRLTLMLATPGWDAVF
jgi:8-oxo-dGTP diphosphatase